MFGVKIHFRGESSERRQLAAVPGVGAYVFGPGTERRLWQVSAVVFAADGVDVYALEVSGRLAGELMAGWADTVQIQEGE